MKQHLASAMSRRQFVSGSAMAAFSYNYIPGRMFGSEAPSNKLNIAGIGIGGMGATGISQ